MIQVIGRSFDIIEYLAKEDPRICTLSEISATVGLNAGTCANILKTLVDRGYVEKTEGKVGYLVGPMFEKLSSVNGFRNRLIEHSEPELKNLTEKYNENTLLAVLNRNTRQAILRVNGTNSVQVITIADREAFLTATGKLLIALLPDKELKQYIKNFGYPTVHFKNEMEDTKAGFFKEIQRIRKRGYAINLGDREVIGLAVPVYKQDIVVASLSMYLPSFRCTKLLQKKILADLQKAGNSISAKL